MNNIKGLVAMQISPLILEKENIKTDQVTATRLLASSDQAWLMEGMISLNPMFITPPSVPEAFAAHDLAYVLEGRFTSYFAGKEMPSKDLGETDIPQESQAEPAAEEGNSSDKSLPQGLVAQNRIIESSKPVKLFVLGCSQMLADNMLDPGGRSTNATFLLNVIDHLNDEDQIAVMRSKQQTLNPLAPITPFTRGIVKTVNIVVLPILVVLFGLGVFMARKARKNKISKMFNV